MNTIKDIVVNETVTDVVTALMPGSSLPRLDRLYTEYRFDVIASGELVSVYNNLFEKGVLVKGAGGHTEKGPNWKPPRFVTEKKYKAS